MGAATTGLLAAVEARCTPYGHQELLDLRNAQRAAPPARVGPFGQPLGAPGPAEAVCAYVLWAAATLMIVHAEKAGMAPAEYVDLIAGEVTRESDLSPEVALPAQLCWVTLGALARDHPTDDGRLDATLTLARSTLIRTDLADLDSTVLLDLIDFTAKVAGSTAHALGAT